MSQSATTKESHAVALFADFLESHPPGQIVKITDFSKDVFNGYLHVPHLTLPEIQLHCNNQRCNGVRVFRSKGQNISIKRKEVQDHFVAYKCSNCQEDVKTFSIRISKDELGDSGYALKFGEFPSFGPPTPSRVLKLIGPDRDSFLKGRRCENQGLGIGASVYYRRVVENQKNRILEEIKRVAEKLGANSNLIDKIDLAIAEIQFTKSLQLAKDGIPESLLINGHNPMTLLHSALSEGVHEMSDEDCLEIASSVRIILTELSDRMANALKDEAELNNAVTKLINRKKSG